MESNNKQNYDVNYLDELLINLPQPDFDPVTHKKKNFSLTGWGSFISTKISSNIASWQSGKSLNENGAKQFLMACINDPYLKDSLKNHSKKIMELYDRLAHLSDGENGTWADGIDRELLVPSEEIIEEEEEPLIRDLKTKIFNNVLLNTKQSKKSTYVSEDISIEDEWIEPQAIDKLDLAGQKHVFKEIDGQKPPSNRILFQICADEFGLGSELEGGQSKIMVEYLHSFLTNTNKFNNRASFDSKIIDELASVIDIKNDSQYSHVITKEASKYVDLARNQISKSLQGGKSQLIIGGWNGKPHGHAIYYEIIPDKNGMVNFRLYNTGAGINHHLSVRDGHKIKYLPFCEWKGIAEENVLCDNFLRSIYELNSSSTFDSSTNTNYNEDDVYLGLKRILNPAIEINNTKGTPRSEEMMSPQRSGVCSFRSLMAFMRSKMNPTEYKRFKCDFKLQVLNDFIQANVNNNEVKVEDWRLIRKTHQSICRSIIKLHEQKLVGDDYILSVQKVLKDSANWIDRNENCRYVSKFSPIELTYTSCSSGKTVENKYALRISLQEIINGKAVEGLDVQDSGLMFEAFKKIQLTNASSIENDLKLATEIAKKSWRERNDISLHTGLLDLTTRLSLEQDFWKEAIANQPEKAEQMIVQLGEISNYFLKSCFTTPHPSIINPEKIYVFKKLMCLQNMICRLGHPKSEWAEMDFTFLGHSDDFYNILTNVKMRKEIDLIHTMTSSRIKKGSIQIKRETGNTTNVSIWNTKVINLSDVRSEDKSVGLKIEYKVDQYNIDKPIEKIIREKYPSVIREIKDADKNFNDLPEKCQDAHIFASDLLPTWLKAMRDTCFAADHLLKSDAGPLISLNRKIDILTRFKLQDDPQKNTSTLHVSLEGVNKDIYNDPEVKRIKDNKLSFAGIYSNENSPFLNELKNLLKTAYWHQSNEKNIFQKKEKLKIKYPHDSTFKEVAHILLNSQLRYLEALEYFTNHPEKLKDRDFQILFHVIIFGDGLESMLKIKGFEDQLAHFIKKNYKFFLEENEIQTAVFLLKLSHQLKNFCSEKPIFMDSIIELEKLTYRKEMEHQDRSIIFAELIVQLSTKDILNENDIKLMLIGTVYLKENKIEDSNKRDPDTMRRVDEALIRHASQIRQFLEAGDPNQQLLNDIFKTLRQHDSTDKIWLIKAEEGKFPYFATSDGEYLFYPLAADLQSIESYNLIPSAIRENTLFKQNFQGIERARILQGNVYSFVDQGRNTLVHLNGDSLIIEKQLFKNDPNYYRLVPSTAFIFEDQDGVKSHLGSRIIAQNYSIWQLLDNQGEARVFVALNKSGTALYHFTGSKQSLKEVQATVDEKRREEENKIRRENPYSSEAILNRLFNEQLPPKVIFDSQTAFFRIEEVSNSEGLKLGKTSRLFTHFEDQGYIHEWYDSNHKLVKVELPRFHLTFTSDAKTGKLSCEKFKGFYLNSSREVSSLGVHKHFIALENSRGECKILLPVQETLPPQKKEVLLPRYDIEKNLERGDETPQKYFVYDLAKNGELTNKSKEANFYLAQILATVQQYKKAIECLKKFGIKLTQYSAKEKFALENITKIGDVTGDISGNGAAIRLFAYYLLLKNASLHQLQLSKNEIKHLGIQYSLYLDHYNNISVQKLMKEQEIVILKALLQENYDASHHLRLQELDPAASRKFVRISHQDANETISTDPIVKEFIIVESSFIKSDKKYLEKKDAGNQDIDDFVFSENFMEDYLKINELLMTRAHISISKFFQYYYEMARNANAEQKNWFRGVIPFLSTVENGKFGGMAKIFEAILEDPKGFPAVPQSTYSFTKDEKLKKKWESKIREQAKNHFNQKIKHNFSQDLGPKKDITSKHFRLDKKIPLIKEIEIKESPNQSTKINSNQFFPLSRWCEDVSFFNREIKPINSNQVEDCKNIIQKIKLDDPVAQKEQQRLVKDFDSLPSTTIYQINSLDNKMLESVTQSINVKLSDAELSLKTLRIELDQLKNTSKDIVELKINILNLANKEMGLDSEKNLNQIRTWAGSRKLITMDELIILFARKNVSALLQRNPALTKEDALKLMESIESYLLHETQEQQRIRVDETLQQLEAIQNNGGKFDTAEVQDYINELAGHALAERQYNSTVNPAYLAFEYFANIVMRPAQVEKLQAYIDKGDLNLIMEMIMGSGKSKVLLPLLGLLRADGQKLSMLIVPQPLFESVSQDVQTILQSFEQALHTLHFDRGTKFTEESLDGILDELINIRKNRECLIMTSKSVQCLLLKYIEKCSEHFSGPNKDKEFSVEIQTMRKILNLLKESGYPIIDEADSILNILHEVCFSLGKCSPPQIKEFEIISAIYGLVYENPEISKLFRVESNSPINPEGQPLTQELYFEKVQTPLVEQFVVSLGTMTFESPVLTDKMRKFVQKLDKKNEKLLKAYLTRGKTHSDAAQKFFDGLDADIQDIIALAGEQISHLLPYTLTKVCDVKYGLDFDENTQKIKGIFAIPYAATKTPSSGSQFANPHVTMNYTFQTYMKNGVTYDLIEEQVKMLQGKAMKELIVGGKEMDISETEAWKAFNSIQGDLNIPFKYNKKQLEALVDYINGNPETKRKFVTEIILPQLEIFQSKISCNPHNLVRMFEHVSGFTGTLWNALSMHHSLKPIAEMGIDAKTLSILFKNSRNNVIEIKEGSSDSMLNQLSKQSVDFDVISDAGGYFKDGSNVQIAHKISNIFGKEVVCYKGEQVITNGDGEIPLAQSDKKEGDRLTFLDQSHTTGADVPQKRDAVGLVTIGPNMLLRDLLQSVWRLRGLDKSQKVRFLISAEVAEIIRQTLKLESTAPINFDQILSFVIMNQATQKGLDAHKALRQELELIPQTILLKVLMNDKIDPLLQLQAHLKLQSEWIKPAFMSAKELYGALPTMTDSSIVVNAAKHDSVLKIKTFYKEMPWLEEVGMCQNDWLNEVDLIISHLENNVPAQLPSPSRNTENDQTVETQLKTETQAQAQSELESQKSNSLRPQINQAYINGGLFKAHGTFQNCISYLQKELVESCGTKDLDNAVTCVISRESKCPSFSVKSYFESDPALKQWAGAFEGIDMTVNVLEWNWGNREDSAFYKKIQATDFNLFGENRIPFHHLSIKDSKVTLMSVEQAENYLNLDEYYNLTLGYTERERNKKLPNSERLKIVKIKFLNGESQFDSAEIELLKIWFKSQGVGHMKDFYEKFVISGTNQKEKAAAYHSESTLKRFFMTL